MADVGDTLGRYRLVEALGRGGSGTVFRAVDTRLETDVCLKILHAGLAQDEEAMRRFEREVLVARKVQHPNVCQVFDVQEADGEHFLVMEWVEGRPLSEELKERAPSLKDAVRIVRGIASAVAAAHAQGVVHRDLKPQNTMMLPSGDIKLLDFGIASSARLGRLTEPGTVMGTAGYLPPEGLRGHNPTPAWDVWAIGVLLYRMTAGRPPFRGHDFESLRTAILELDPPPLRQLNPDVPEGLAAVVSRALQKQPTARYATARELDDALAPFDDVAGDGVVPNAPVPDARTEPTVVVRRPSEPVPGARPRSRVPVLLAAAAVVVVLVGVAAALWSSDPVVTPAPTVAALPTPEPPATPSPAEPPTTAPTETAADEESDAVAVTDAGPSADAGGQDREVAENDEPTPTPANAAGSSTASRLRAVYRRERRAAERALKQRALLRGDDGAVDSQRAKMIVAARSRRYEAAASAARGLQKAVADVKIDKRFVLAKLARFNGAYDAVEDPPTRKELASLSVKVNQAFRAGEYDKAHRLLNQGFRTAKRSR